jgi:hypothetical protein
LGADRPLLWRSPEWELQVVRRQLYTSTVISDARTASAFLNGHLPMPECSHLSLYMRKKLSDIVNFLKSLEFCRNIMYEMMQLKMHGF